MYIIISGEALASEAGILMLMFRVKFYLSVGWFAQCIVENGLSVSGYQNGMVGMVSPGMHITAKIWRRSILIGHPQLKNLGAELTSPP